MTVASSPRPVAGRDELRLSFALRMASACGRVLAEVESRIDLSFAYDENTEKGMTTTSRVRKADGNSDGEEGQKRQQKKLYRKEVAEGCYSQILRWI